MAAPSPASCRARCCGCRCSLLSPDVLLPTAWVTSRCHKALFGWQTFPISPLTPGCLTLQLLHPRICSNCSNSENSHTFISGSMFCWKQWAFMCLQQKKTAEGLGPGFVYLFFPGLTAICDTLHLSFLLQTSDH